MAGIGPPLGCGRPLAGWHGRMGVAVQESSLPDDDYLGAISVSGAARLGDFMKYLNDTPGRMEFLPYVAAGIRAFIPAFKPEEILMPRAMQYYRQATIKGCWFYGYALYKNMPKATALKSGWSDSPSVQRYVAESKEGAIPITERLLVLSGDADLTVPMQGVRQIVARACRNGTALTFKSYPGLDHDPTMVQSIADQLAWMRDRWAGKQAVNTCSRE